MKKLLSILLTTVLSITLLVPAVAAATDFSGGLLDGKPGYIGNGSTTTSVLTDNNESNGVTLTALNTSNFNVNFNFEKIDTADITAYRLVAASGAVLKFFDSNMQEIGQQILNPVINGTLTPISVSGVKLVQVYNRLQTNIVVSEINVYGTVFHHEPFNLVASADGESIILSWTSDDFEPKKYKVLRSEQQDGVFVEIANNISGKTYTDLSVEGGKTYYYKVLAYNSRGESDPSNIASATAFSLSRAILEITLENGFVKEYDLSMNEVEAFLDWYDNKDAGVGPARYSFNKDWNKGPFLKRTEYVIFDKIMTFEISEYSTEN